MADLTGVGTIDLQQASPLHKAIYKKDINRVKKIILAYDTQELKRELIHFKLPFLTTLGLAFKVDHTKRIGTWLLRFVLDPDRTEDAAIPSWFELFEMTERFYKHFQSKLTAKRMAQVLSGLGHYIASSEVTLNEFVSRPKFFKAAYLLGAKYIPQRHGDSFASYVYRSSIIKRPEKRKLYEWMWDVVMYSEHPFDLRIQVDLLMRHAYRLEVPHFYQYIIALSVSQRCDEEGCNVLHYAAYRRKPYAFYGSIGFLLKLGYQEEVVIDMLLTKNARGVTPLAIGIIIYAGADLLWFSPEVGLAVTTIATAIRKVVRIGDLELIKPVFQSHVLRSCKPFVYYLYSLGVTAEVVSKVFGATYNDIFDEPRTTHVSYRLTSVVEQNNTTGSSFDLSNLLPELAYEIALHLCPEDMMSFFTSTTNMVNFLRQSTDRFWNEYYKLHYRPLQTVNTSVRRQVIQDIRGRKNWRSKNYQELRFPGCKIAVLDENWMIFLSTNRYARFNDEAVQRTTSFFNCHTQRKHDGITATNITVHPNVILSSTQYGAERDPVYFGETPIRNKYQIVRNRQVIDCKAIEALMRGRSPYHSVNYYAMDQRMFISERCAIYDADYDKIVGTLPGATNFHHKSRTNTYLPQSRQIYTENGSEILLYDLNYHRVATLPLVEGVGIPHQVDEHTLFYSGGTSGPALLDLRTGRMMRAFNGSGRGRDIVVSTDCQRVVFAHPTLRILTSWDLSARRWEFVDDNWFLPRAANQRYLVGENDPYETIVRDFCGQ